MRASLILCLALVSGFLSADVRGEDKPQTSPARLSLGRLFSASEFEGQGSSAKWLPTGASYTQWDASAETKDARDIVRYDALTGQKEVLVAAAQLIPPGQSKPLAVADYRFSEDLSQVLLFTNTRQVWRHHTRGDYWLLDRSSRELRKLGGNGPEASLMFAKLNPRERQVAWVRDRNISIEDLRNGAPTAITNTPTPDLINGTFDWVYEEELDLRDGFRWSPDGKQIAFWQLDTSEMKRFPLVNTEARLYPDVQFIPWPKVGERNPACRVGIFDLSSQKTQWINLPGDNRDHYIARMDWRPNSSELVLQQLNRRQNTNRLFLASAQQPDGREFFVERDDAWVDITDETFWLPKSSHFTWISERSGWRHVYVVGIDGSIEPLTSGEFDVIKLLSFVAPDPAAGLAEHVAYFMASPNNATQSYLYRTSLEKRVIQRVTPADQVGSHSYVISPDGRAALHTFSTYMQPPVTEVVSLPDHKVIRTLVDNKPLQEKVKQLESTPIEFFRVKIAEGVELDGWCQKPPHFDASKKYPLLVYVYGEPAGQTVVDRWGGSRSLWHLMLAQQGCVVMSFDNRGTHAARGREWRKSVYRQIGVLGPDDQAAAVRTVLKERTYLDAERVAIWGWSGGGSSTLHAMFRFPDLYRTGISVAPVPNQRHYDTIYQERYMGLPADNVDGFTRGSPITWAKQLKGNLLLIHGTGDDNCHYATTELLIDELIRHGKQFDLMAYPNRSHSIREGANTVPHLYQLMTRYLERHLRLERSE